LLLRGYYIDILCKTVVSKSKTVFAIVGFALLVALPISTHMYLIAALAYIHFGAE